MKQTTKTVLLALACVALAACGANDGTSESGTGLAEGDAEETLCGGFSEQRPLTAEDSALFAQVAEPNALANLRPISVSTQVVAGTNYLFVCETKDSGDSARKVTVRIFRPLPGRSKPELVAITSDQVSGIRD